MSTSADVVVVGGGAIGIAVAWRAAQAGLSVTVVDPDPMRGAWRTAAGMLAPATELHYAESALLRLNLDSMARFPGFVAELEDVSGLATGHRTSGTVQVAWDAADLAALRDLHAFGIGLGLTPRMLSGAELRRLEPALAAGLPGGMLAEHEAQINPRRLHAALTEAAARTGVDVVTSVAALDVKSDAVRGVRLADGSHIKAGQVVLAAGAWSSQPEVCSLALPTIRPVKGQTLRLHLAGPDRFAHVVRGNVKGNAIYILPREGGEVVLGASCEEVGFDVRPRAGAVYEMLRDAQSLIPELSEAELVEVSTALRPGSPDNAPLIGACGIEGLALATGHYRNGILLTPVTADAITELLTTGVAPAVIEPFSPLRTAAIT